MSPTHVRTCVRYVLGAIRAVGTTESRRLTALEFRMIVKIVLVTEDTRASKTGEPRFFDGEVIDGDPKIRTFYRRGVYEFEGHRRRNTVWNRSERDVPSEIDANS